jgi:hypothetical protein
LSARCARRSRRRSAHPCARSDLGTQSVGDAWAAIECSGGIPRSISSFASLVYSEVAVPTFLFVFGAGVLWAWHGLRMGPLSRPAMRRPPSSERSAMTRS